VKAVLAQWAYPSAGDDAQQIALLKRLYRNDKGSRLRKSMIKVKGPTDLAYKSGFFLE